MMRPMALGDMSSAHSWRWAGSTCTEKLVIQFTRAVSASVLVSVDARG